MRVVILGAGFGGLELSTRLSEELGDGVQVTLIDKSDVFVFGYAKLDVMFGRRTFDEVRLPYSAISRPNVEFRQETVTSIDATAKRVTTDKGSYEADVLVIALGADYDVAATPGFAEAGHEFYSPEGAAALRETLESFQRGDLVVSVLGPFFKCPAAPYETVFLLHDLLVARGIRDACTITLVTTMPKPIPISDEVSGALLALCDERTIHHSHATRIESLDPVEKVARANDGRTFPFDLFLGIPVHKAPDVVVESGLTDDGWIAVDKATLATKFPGVYAVGDITSAPVPRAGGIAEGEAKTVAEVLIAQAKGGPAPAPYDGRGVCYVEMGGQAIGRVDVDFLTGPAPTALYGAPTLETAEEKREFGAIRRRRWFGLD
ncbi:MAG TPA: FAD-dependent oxidoreductase [Acidimicrobiales bacterium]|nr:FAD-dependent oxidoreductase [Acidimicrobiales bacterium]